MGKDRDPASSKPDMFMFASKSTKPAGARGRRAYVIGDIHGRLDLLETLLAKVDGDIEARPCKGALLVFVGDLIDRGPSSAQVVERLRTYRRDGVRPVFLLGNHEEVLLRVVRGEADLVHSWLRFGGTECLKSYGVDARRLAAMRNEDVLAAIAAAIPPEHIEFLESFCDTCRFGDYLFVHAGIRPGIELEEQRQADLRWIREPFLSDDSDHGFVVVHGHTISEDVEVWPNRIGIDTGAYRSGILTALAVDGTERWFLDTRVPARVSIPAMH
jgi:serine/threonine protein phosphatase 1